MQIEVLGMQSIDIYQNPLNKINIDVFHVKQREVQGSHKIFFAETPKSVPPPLYLIDSSFSDAFNAISTSDPVARIVAS